MYVIRRAVGLKPEFGGRYLPIMMTDVAINQLVDTFGSVIVELSHTSDQAIYNLNIEDLAPEIQASTLTLAQWLSINQEKSLPTLDGPIKLSYAYVNFYDAWLYDFSITRFNHLYHPDMDIADDQAVDLNLTKPTADYVNMGKYCVFTVGGMLHRSDANSNGVIIFDGGKSAEIAETNHVGFMDFQHIGQIEIIPITEDMIHSRGSLKLYHGAYLKLPKSVAGKVAMLSIGGFLHALDKSYSVVSDNVIKIDFTNYSFETRLDEMRKRIDVSSIDDLMLGGDTVQVTKLWSEKTVKQLLTLSQSFIILVDTLELQKTEVPLEHAALPGVYYGYSKPKYPIVIGNGKLAEYRAEHQHGVYAINISDYLTDKYVRETTGYRSGMGYGSNLFPAAPVAPAVARQLLISKTLKG